MESPTFSVPALDASAMVCISRIPPARPIGRPGTQLERHDAPRALYGRAPTSGKARVATAASGPPTRREGRAVLLSRADAASEMPHGARWRKGRNRDDEPATKGC